MRIIFIQDKKDKVENLILLIHLSFYASTFGGHLPPFFRGHFNRFFQLKQQSSSGKRP